MHSYGIGMSVSEAREALKRGDISILELVEAHIRRIEDVNGKINAVVHPMYEQAVEQAREASKIQKKNRDTSKLFGIPLTLKDQFMVRGTPTSCGLSHRSWKCIDDEGSLVRRLREEGAIILGKTNLPQLLFSHECEHAHYGSARNPWNLERTTGGSSGGEAGIIAAGGSMLGLGGDMGGSLRVPAHCCGIHTIKPTSGRLPNDDTPMELGYFAEFAGFEGFMVQPGPMARSVEDLKIMLDCFLSKPLKSAEPCSPHSWLSGTIPSPDGLRIGIYTDNNYFSVSPAISRVVNTAARALKDAGLPVDLFTPPDPAEGMNIYMSLLSADGGQWIKNALNGEKPTDDIKSFMQLAGLPNFLRSGISKLMGLMGQGFASSSIMNAGRLSVHEYWETTMKRTNYRTRFLEAMNAQNIDIILCPPYGLPAPQHGSNAAGTGGIAASHAAIFNLLGMPAGVVAAGRVGLNEESERKNSKDRTEILAKEIEKGSEGMPVGVQVIGRHWREDQVLSVMKILEEYFRCQPDYPKQPPQVLATVRGSLRKPYM